MRVAILALTLTLAGTGGTAAVADTAAAGHAAGQAVYQKWCAPCHAPGVTHPGTHALMTKYDGIKSGVILEWKDLPSSTVKYWVRHGVSVMPHFRKTEISDAELDELARYLARNTPGG
jgi:mono/diheme cytochrome c family protein